MNQSSYRSIAHSSSKKSKSMNLSGLGLNDNHKHHIDKADLF
jgi:hypothetical protein